MLRIIDLKGDTMNGKMPLLAMLLIAGCLLVIPSPALYAGCREDCTTNCCGDEGICNGDDEQSCVSDCLKDCGDDSGPDASSLAPSDNTGNSGGGDEVDADDTVPAPGKKHPPLGGSIEPHQKVPNGKQPAGNVMPEP
jgi:hypothetical protein